ncbi:hypothetical protein KA183_01270 [bacterium]|nr:hypothetical protein [bacterium]QQR59080.1 MAG: hypothetical protein IPG59_06210 [Candidatus Melainabacteria bacterium]
MSDRKDTSRSFKTSKSFEPFSEIPVTFVDEAKLSEYQLNLLKQLTIVGPLKVPRRCNFYQAIEERAVILGLSLTHEEIYSLAKILNRNPILASGKTTSASSNNDENDPSTWTGPREDFFNQIKTMFPDSAFANPEILKSNVDFITELNSKLLRVSSQDRRRILEWLRNNSTRPGIQSKLRIEVSDQHYSLSYYNKAGQQEFIGNRRQQYSDVAVLNAAPRSAQKNLERVRQDLQDMPVTANDFTRASLFRNLIRAIASAQSGISINWREAKIGDESLQEILDSKSMDLTIEGIEGDEKLALTTRDSPARALFVMYAKEIGSGQVLNQTKFRGAHLAEGLRMAMLDIKAQTTLIHLKHIATSLKTTANVETFNELLSGINQSLAQMTTPLGIVVSDGQVRLLRNGLEIQNMNVQLDISSTTQNKSLEANRLQNILSNPEKIRMLRKATETLATAKTPLEKLHAAAIYLQEGMEKTSFSKDGKNYTFNFQTTKVDGDLKNVEISIIEAESLTSAVLAKGLISIRGKNVRVIESATAP